MSSNIKITLPNGSIVEHVKGVTGYDIAFSISESLARESVAILVNDKMYDLSISIAEDSTIQIIKRSDDRALDIIRHDCAHIMAQAVQELFPGTQVTIGPTIENGFYYDFYRQEGFGSDDLDKIENRMHQIVEEDIPFQREVWDRSAAIKYFKDLGESYKAEIISELPENEEISIYRQGDWLDLCRGPHLPSTKFIGKAFKLMNIAGAYWRGDESNAMLTRIYGTAWHNEKDLRKHLNMLKEAEKRDHRKLGKELNIFTFDEEVGPGLPLWLPNGTILIDELEKLAKDTESDLDYDRVKTPHITKDILYEKSGHLSHYEDSMFPAMDIDGSKYYLKPMNCPHHHKIYASIPRTYKELPIRFSEYGTCYRYEKSGQLFGLMRVRSMQMNDAHIYCTEEQFKNEFLSVCKMYLKYFDIFGIDKYEMRLSLHDADKLGKKYVDEPELWIKTEQLVREALEEGEINFIEIPGEAAFYGPKIDVQVWSAIGREFTLATNQVDFAIPSRFNLKYIDKNDSEQTPLCIHRAPLGTHERFIGFLIEHFAGNFPVWLSPVQAIIIPISEKFNGYCEDLMKNMKNQDIRVKLDDRNEKMGAKIRQAELNKIPIMVIVGENEVSSNEVSIRRRYEGNIGSFKINDFLNDITNEINNKDRRVLK